MCVTYVCVGVLMCGYWMCECVAVGLLCVECVWCMYYMSIGVVYVGVDMCYYEWGCGCVCVLDV